MKAFQQPDVVIVNEVNWTPTARMADIVLPATTSYERNDLTMAGDYSMMSIYPMKQVVPPQFEAKNDYDIFAELAKRAGVEEQYTEGKTEMEWLEEFYNAAFTAARANRVAMPRFDKFWAENKPLSFEAGEAAKNGCVMASSVKIHCLTLSVRRQAKLRFSLMLSRKCIITTVKVIQAGWNQKSLRAM